MDNKVKNAHLAYYVDNSPAEESHIPVSGAKFPSEEFALDIWFNISQSGHVIVSQKNGFSLGIDNSKVIFKHPSMTAVTVKNDIVKIPAKIWTNLYMGYDKKELVFYINGVKFGSVSCNKSILNSEDFILGEEFTGYIRSFRLYGKTIAESDFKNYCFAVTYDEKKMPNTVAFMDLTDKNIPDLSGHGVKARVQKGSTYLNMVDVYRPSAGKYAYFSDSSAINPGGFASGEFSVYTKLHIRPSQKTRHIITANGNLGDDDSVIIFADGAESGTSFGISIGGREYSFKTDIGAYNWVDVIFSAKGKQLTAYINGVQFNAALQEEIKRDKKGDFKIGGCNGAPEQTCEHYLHTVAVFDRQLGDKDAADFMENHPFILEDGLAALVSFDGCRAKEFVKRVNVIVDNDDLFSATRTVGVMPDTPYEYRVNYTKQPASKMKAWEAEHLIEAYKLYGEEIYGLACCASLAALTALIAYLSHDQEVLNSIAGLYIQETVTAENIASAMGQLGETMSRTMFEGMGFASASAAASSATAASAASAGAAAASTFASESFYPMFMFGAGVVIAAAAATASSIQKTQKDKPDDDDDDKNVELSLISITLQYSPDDYKTSAVRCRNYNGVISGAEWTKEKKCVYPAVYIADQIQKPKIKVKFKISEHSAKSNGVCKVTLRASVSGGTSKLFDTFQYEKSGLTPGKEYEAVLESSTTASVAKDISYEQIELWWSGTVDKDVISIPNTKVDVYVIPTTPCPPISLEDNCEDMLLAVEYLKIFTRMLENTGRENRQAISNDSNVDTVSLNDLKRMTLDLYNSPCFEYVALRNPQYVKFKELKDENEDAVIGTLIRFNELQFLKDTAQFNAAVSQKIPIESEVYAAILCYRFKLLGLYCRLAYVVNPVHKEAGLERLHVKNVFSAGHPDVSQDYNFNYHMIVELSPQMGVSEMTGDCVFDASLSVRQNGVIQPLAGIPFSGINHFLVNKAAEAGSYRSFVFEDNSGAVILSDSFIFSPVKNW